jgi:phage terminase large subunit-like protein
MPFHTYAHVLHQAKNAYINRTKREIDPEALACQTDFLKFREYVCGHSSPKHHRRWEKLINTGEDSKSLKGIAGPNTLILSPRGSAKSTFQVEWTAWVIGTQTLFGTPLKVLYVSYSIEVAMLKSEQIKDIVSSDKFQEVFPHIRPGRKWGDKIWDIDKLHAGLPLLGENYTMATAGMKGAVASKRASLVLMDDICKSPEQIENPQIRERMANNWLNVIRPVMYEGARAICLGTRMLADDIYESTFTKERGWEVIEESAIIEDEDGEEVSYWPEQHSLEYLQFLRDDDPGSFSLQFQNRLPEEGEGLIQKEWLRDGIPPELDQFDSLVISSDFSSSEKEKADYTVFLLWGRIGDEYWVLDMRRGRWGGNIDKCNVLIAMLCDWGILEAETDYEVDYRSGKVKWFCPPEENPVVYQTSYYLNFYVEGVSYQLSFKADWKGYVQNTLNVWNITCLPLKVQGDKLQRLRGVTGVLQRGKVWFNKYRKLKRVKQELLGAAGKDDCQDSFVLGLTGMGARNKLEAM